VGEHVTVRLGRIEDLASDQRIPSLPSDDARVRVAGRVVDASGVALAGVRVLVTDEAGLEKLVAGRERASPSRSDFDGRFSVDRRASMPFPMFLAYKPGYAVLARSLAAEPETSEWNLVLERGSAITGSVVDPSGLLLTNVEVALRGSWKDGTFPMPFAARANEVVLATTRTDSLGRFRFEDVPAGKWRAEARSGAFTAHTQAMHVAGGESLSAVRIDFAERTASVRGRVAASDGTPIAGLLVSVYRPGVARPLNLRNTTDEQGSFELSDLREDDEWIVAETWNGKMIRGFAPYRYGTPEVSICVQSIALVRGRIRFDVEPATTPRFVRALCAGLPTAATSTRTDSANEFQLLLERGTVFDLEIDTMPAETRAELVQRGVKVADCIRRTGFVASGEDIEIRLP
jgi:hypothetical protein